MIVSGTPNEQFWAPVIAKSFRDETKGIYLDEVEGEIIERNDGYMPGED